VFVVLPLAEWFFSEEQVKVSPRKINPGLGPGLIKKKEKKRRKKKRSV
jgi:hypothetical protein